jgi:response regulator RpfG family c-di-GMP phosphodiesterase
MGIIDRLLKEKPDAVILDIIKPTPEGTALCNAIKKTKLISHIPVIVLSTHPNIKSTKIACADEIISKPFDIIEMIKTVENHLLV